jgi:hypothetical protein
MPESQKEGKHESNLSPAEAAELAKFQEGLAKLKAEGTLSPQLHQRLVEEVWNHYPLPEKQGEEVQAEETGEKPAARKARAKTRSTGRAAGDTPKPRIIQEIMETEKQEAAATVEGWKAVVEEEAAHRAESQQQRTLYMQELEKRYPGVSQVRVKEELPETNEQRRQREQELQEWRERDRGGYAGPPDEIEGDDRWVERYALSRTPKPETQLNFDPDKSRGWPR